MSLLQSTFSHFGAQLLRLFTNIRWVDFLDMAVMAYIIYHGVRMVRETRAMQLVKGIAAIFLLYFVSIILKMVTLQFFIRYISQVGIYLLLVLFQPELRRALEQMGRSKLGVARWFGMSQTGEQETNDLEALIEIVGNSCERLSAESTGALIVIERETKLGDVIKTGTLVDSAPSVELIGNIFFHNSPLHDGAMIVRDCRLYAAGCYLPLSHNMEIGRELGTRHRAALGMSEVSDAVVVIVSEETGAISVASDSRLQRKLSPALLKKLLHKKLLGDKKQEPAKKEKLGFWRAKK